jgi:hypothetical protein
MEDFSGLPPWSDSAWAGYNVNVPGTQQLQQPAMRDGFVGTPSMMPVPAHTNGAPGLRLTSDTLSSMSPVQRGCGAGGVTAMASLSPSRGRNLSHVEAGSTGMMPRGRSPSRASRSRGTGGRGTGRGRGADSVTASSTSSSPTMGQHSGRGAGGVATASSPSPVRGRGSRTGATSRSSSPGRGRGSSPTPPRSPASTVGKPPQTPQAAYQEATSPIDLIQEIHRLKAFSPEDLIPHMTDNHPAVELCLNRLVLGITLQPALLGQFPKAFVEEISRGLMASLQSYTLCAKVWGNVRLNGVGGIRGAKTSSRTQSVQYGFLNPAVGRATDRVMSGAELASGLNQRKDGSVDFRLADAQRQLALQALDEMFPIFGDNGNQIKRTEMVFVPSDHPSLPLLDLSGLTNVGSWFDPTMDVTETKDNELLVAVQLPSLSSAVATTTIAKRDSITINGTQALVGVFAMTFTITLGQRYWHGSKKIEEDPEIFRNLKLSHTWTIPAEMQRRLILPENDELIQHKPTHNSVAIWVFQLKP